MKIVNKSTGNLIFESDILVERDVFLNSIKTLKYYLSKMTHGSTIALVDKHGNFEDWLENLDGRR